MPMPSYNCPFEYPTVTNTDTSNRQMTSRSPQLSEGNNYCPRKIASVYTSKLDLQR